MRKHPVDDLFKSKLSNWEKQPSSRAWARIAQEQKTKDRKLGLWVWYAAASIVVATMVGYLVWPGTDESQYLSMEKVSETADVPSPVSTDTTQKKVPVMPIEKAVESMEVPAVRLAGKSEVKAENKSDANDKSNFYAQTEIKGIKEEEIAVLEIQKEDHTKDVKAMNTPEFSKENGLQTALALREPEVKEENRTIVVNVKVPENEFDDKSKTSKFTRVFRQLKNARAGDPVDWQEIGFNPRNIVAKVDERIRDKEEVISEKYQNIKQRTKL